MIKRNDHIVLLVTVLLTVLLLVPIFGPVLSPGITASETIHYIFGVLAGYGCTWLYYFFFVSGYNE